MLHANPKSNSVLTHVRVILFVYKINYSITLKTLRNKKKITEKHKCVNGGYVFKENGCSNDRNNTMNTHKC